MTSKHDNDFYWLNYLLSFATENKLESSIKLCENKDFCNTLIPSEYTKILEFNQNQKSDKAPCIIYEDLKCIIKTIYGCKNNPENSYTSNVGKHVSPDFQCLQYHHLKA